MLPFTTSRSYADEVADSANEEQMPLFQYPIRVRLHSSVGFTERSGLEGLQLGWAAGAQVVLPANRTQGFGFTVGYVQVAPLEAGRYIDVGLHIEQRLFDWLLMVLEPKAFVPLADTDTVPFGLTTRLGWMAPPLGALRPVLSVRNDWIFTADVPAVLSFELSFEIPFGAGISD